MNDKIKGFVLSLSDYKEADVLMQVLTKDYGILSLVGKSAKKLSSKNHFLPTCLYEFILDYKDGKTIYSIHGSRLLENYFEDGDIGAWTGTDAVRTTVAEGLNAGAVRYDTEQFLSYSQKIQAIKNIQTALVGDTDMNGDPSGMYFECT